MRNLERRFAGLCLVACLAGASVLPAPALADGTATLTVRIENVDPRGGMMRLGLYDAAAYAKDADALVGADVKADAGVTVITLTNLKPGTYAIEAYQDINSNDKMDTSWFGIPQEPYGFSRDAKPFLSKPRFAAVQFTVTQGENFQGLHLQNSVSLIAAE